MPELRMFWRQLTRLFILDWSLLLAYRGEILLWLMAVTATPLLSLAIWYQVAKSSGPSLQQEILTYYLLLIVVRSASTSWRGYELIREILNGHVISYLIRPPVIFWEFVTEFLTTKVLFLTPSVLIAALLILISPQSFSPTIFSLPHLGLFSISLLLAVILSFTFDICLGLTAFWLEDAQELMAFRFLLTQVASGVLIPFSLMPSWLHFALSFLPFRYTVSAPVEILLGQITGLAALQLLGIQLIWSIGLILLMRFLFVRGLKHYVIPGQ
jgi:ABC-2 type transport system permease protein